MSCTAAVLALAALAGAALGQPDAPGAGSVYPPEGIGRKLARVIVVN